MSGWSSARKPSKNYQAVETTPAPMRKVIRQSEGCKNWEFRQFNDRKLKRWMEELVAVIGRCYDKIRIEWWIPLDGAFGHLVTRSYVFTEVLACFS